MSRQWLMVNDKCVLRQAQDKLVTKAKYLPAGRQGIPLADFIIKFILRH